MDFEHNLWFLLLLQTTLIFISGKKTWIYYYDFVDEGMKIFFCQSKSTTQSKEGKCETQIGQILKHKKIVNSLL
jgi:hypothetical protein